MLVLNKTDIQSIFTMSDAIDASMNALKYYSAGKTQIPLRTVIDIKKQSAKSLFMPAYVEESDTLGIKVVAVFPNNLNKGIPSISGQMLLMDGHTGHVLAILDGAYLTQIRTGALQGVATKLLSKSDAKTAVLFGTGGQAKAQLEAMLTVRDLDLVSVFDIQFERAEAFVMEMQQAFSHVKTTIVAVADATEAIKEADIITAVTTSMKPVFEGSIIKEGAHINGIGAYTPDMQELPELIIQRANKIFFDTSDGVLAEAGDILIPLKKGLISPQSFTGELGDVILGNVKGRESANDITLFKAVGSAVLDVVTAQHIYMKAKSANIGKQINM